MIIKVVKTSRNFVLEVIVDRPLENAIFDKTKKVFKWIWLQLRYIE